MSNCWVAAAVLLLIACSDHVGTRVDQAAALSGQVDSRAVASGASLTHHAASRFLEQASMGPNPQSVASVQRVGLEAWIDSQARQPVSRLTIPQELVDFDDNERAKLDRLQDHFAAVVMDQAVSAEDTLRHRVAWVLSNLLVVSIRMKVSPYGGLEYWNMLMDGALGRYTDLLRTVTIHAAMGHFLDNNTNGRDSLNENYARELLQLFSVGTVLLQDDGTVRRDADGKALETYTQQDVIDMTRALTGWRFAPNPADSRLAGPNANRFNYGRPMVAQDDLHDTGQKTILGTVIPAGGTAAQDLDAVIRVLGRHPNLAPFVSKRLIQGLTTSDPSPAYMRRVVAVFRQTDGNLAAVVKAILLDPEARAGDVPGRSVAGFGRIREFHLLNIHAMRALGCRRAIRDAQRPTTSRSDVLMAQSVFNFFPPDHRVPGSGLLAPEQRLLDAREFEWRLQSWGFVHGQENLQRQAGCEVDLFAQAFLARDERMINLLSDRLFRGVMSPPTRQAFREALRDHPAAFDEPVSGSLLLFQLAFVTPEFGAAR